MILIVRHTLSHIIITSIYLAVFSAEMDPVLPWPSTMSINLWYSTWELDAELIYNALHINIAFSTKTGKLCVIQSRDMADLDTGIW